MATCLFVSRNIDVTRLPSIVKAVEEINGTEYKAVGYVLLVILLLILLICVIFTALIFFWHVQWLRILRYQDKTIFKWVRYQKLGHFLEPYHAPYNAKYRYWTNLLLLVRVLFVILIPRVDLKATIFIVGGLILLKEVTAQSVYKKCHGYLMLWN